MSNGYMLKLQQHEWPVVNTMYQDIKQRYMPRTYNGSNIYQVVEVINHLIQELQQMVNHRDVNGHTPNHRQRAGAMMLFITNDLQPHFNHARTMLERTHLNPFQDQQYCTLRTGWGDAVSYMFYLQNHYHL